MAHDLIPEEMNYDMTLAMWASKERAFLRADSLNRQFGTTQTRRNPENPPACRRDRHGAAAHRYRTCRFGKTDQRRKTLHEIDVLLIW